MDYIYKEREWTQRIRTTIKSMKVLAQLVNSIVNRIPACKYVRISFDFDSLVSIFLYFFRAVTWRIRDKNVGKYVKVLDWFNSRVLKSKGRFKYNIDTESFTTQINVHYTEHSDGQTGRIEKSYSNF